MNKTLIYTTLSAIALMATGSFAVANQYDDMVDKLADSILSQIYSDVPPTGATSQLEAHLLLPDTIFAKKESSYVLLPAAMNVRLNGGILVKDEQDAINYLYEQQLTKYNTIAGFQGHSSLRRDEAAKFFSLFAAKIMKRSEDQSKECVFNDLDKGHVDLQGNIASACRLGIFRGKDGNFNPTGSLTNGEALAVVIRILHGVMAESDPEHWAKNYRLKAQAYGLTQGTILDSMAYLDKPATRGDIARILEAARFIPGLREVLKGDVTYSLTTQGYNVIKQ